MARLLFLKNKVVKIESCKNCILNMKYYGYCQISGFSVQYSDEQDIVHKKCELPILPELNKK